MLLTLLHVALQDVVLFRNKQQNVKKIITPVLTHVQMDMKKQVLRVTADLSVVSQPQLTIALAGDGHGGYGFLLSYSLL